MTDREKLFHDLIESHKGILYKVARTYCPDEADRQDVLQEMMIQIWQSIHRYDGSCKLSTWLYRVCLNTAISQFRKSTRLQARQQPLTAEAERFAESNTPDQEQKLALLDRFIAELNPLDKALMLLYLEDRSQMEIGQILGISTSNVSTKVARIKERLRKQFETRNLEPYER